MQLEILSPKHKVFTGDVVGINLPGVEGSFELLDNHAPLVAALGKGTMKIVKGKNNVEEYKIDGGFIETMQNTTIVLVESAESISY